jgi:hypothetical protein
MGFGDIAATDLAKGVNRGISAARTAAPHGRHDDAI